MKELIDKLREEQELNKKEWVALIENRTYDLAEEVFLRAREVREAIYGRDVYIRGLIEFTNYCRNDCYYCGIRKSNGHASRYRLHPDEIMDCCKYGYDLGFRTFVLQGGEDGFFTDEKLEAIVRAVKQAHPDCAVTLSVGERTCDSYKRLFDAGADRYLLRHETADACHYGILHPDNLSLQNRKQCLWDLKEIGYQVGCGFMVGSPEQTAGHLAEDMMFIKKLKPEMVGIGPFIPHKGTPFARETAGSMELTLFLLGLIRLMLPKVLLPATTALGTIHPEGRELGILAGANVVMPNLSPMDVRGKYLLYNDKKATDAEAAEGLEDLKKRMERIGYRVVISRGDAHV